jgi:hypothetical protein
VKELKLSICEFNDIVFIFDKYHYKKSHMGGGIAHCFALEKDMKLYGGSVTGLPRHEKVYCKDIKTIEIRRMACIEDTPKNIESYFLSKIIWWIRKNTDIKRILSYSDLSVGHVGTIYKAANFVMKGETQPSSHLFYNGIRYHMRSLTIDRPYSYVLREKVKTGEATIEKGKPKLIWMYEL